MRKLTLIAAAVAIAAIAVFYFLTIPATVPAAALPPYTPNLDNGRTMFDIGGCASCHATPNKDPDKVERTRLGGGLALASPFGTFYLCAEHFARPCGRHR
jgi:cbb3-type cytochrome oxidase cytochrome c subunit